MDLTTNTLEQRLRPHGSSCTKSAVAFRKSSVTFSRSVRPWNLSTSVCAAVAPRSAPRSRVRRAHLCSVCSACAAWARHSTPRPRGCRYRPLAPSEPLLTRVSAETASAGRTACGRERTTERKPLRALCTNERWPDNPPTQETRPGPILHTILTVGYTRCTSKSVQQWVVSARRKSQN